MLDNRIIRLQHDGYIVTKILISPEAWADMYKKIYSEEVPLVAMGYAGKFSGVETYIVNFDKNFPLNEQIAYVIKETRDENDWRIRD